MLPTSLTARSAALAVAGSLLGLLPLALPACGGGGGSSSGPTVQGRAFLTDAPAVDVRDQTNAVVFTMTELWLTIDRAVIEDAAGHKVALALPLSPLRVDVMTLTGTSTLLAVGNFPAGTYEELELRVTAAEMTGTHAGVAGVTTVALALSKREFEAEFSPAVVVTSTANSTFVVDWTPAVSADTTGAPTVFTLEDEVKAFVLGGAGAGSPGTMRVHELEGDISAIDCAGSTLTLTRHGASFTVALRVTTTYEDDDGAVLAGGCAALSVGDEVEIDGTVQAGGAVTADRVEVEDAGHHSGGSSGGGAVGHGIEDIEGVVANRAGSGSTITFDVMNGSVVVAHIATDASTEVELDNGGSTTPASIQDGDRVEVEGTVTVAGTPPTVLAEEVEID